MSDSGDAVVSDALRRADVGWLVAYFGAGETCSVAEVRALTRHADPAVRRLGLVLLRARARCAPSAEWAALLPREVPESADTALVVADAYAALHAYVRVGAWPDWRAAGLPARVRLAWLRGEILARPGEAVRAEPVGEELYQAVAAIDAPDVDDLDAFVRALIARSDAVLGRAAVRLVAAGVRTAVARPGWARARLVELLDHPDDVVVADALRESAEPWVAVETGPPPVRALRALASGRGDVVAAAIRFGCADVVFETAADPGVSGAMRRCALAGLGETAGRDEVAGLLRLAATDPLLLAEPAVEALRAMHDRGHFVRDRDAAAVVALALADHRIAARAVAVVLFTARQAAFEALIDAPAADPAWPRRLDLLVALAAQGMPDVPIGAAVAARLAEAPAPAPFLAALRELRHAGGEDAALAALPRAPGPALTALAAIGGPATQSALRKGLGLDAGSTGAVAPELRGVLPQALEVLWHLTESPDLRRELATRLNARRLPDAIASDLGGPDPAELALLASHPDPADPTDALCRLARNAAPIPVLADLLLRVVADLAAGAATSTDAAAPVVPEDAVEAIEALGEALHRRRRLRPACLLDADSPEAARHALVAGIALDVIDRPDVGAAETAILLELLARTPYRRTAARVHRLVRHRDPDVRGRAIAVLARDTDRDAARALSASLIPLTASPDARTVRQALLALGHARARGAGDAVAAALAHPVMNVKKTAADALAHTGGPAQVPTILAWLGRHENPGLRTALVAAARAILGDAYAATLLAAADRTGDDRTRGLLVDALDAHLSPRALTVLAGGGTAVGDLVRRRVAAQTLRPAPEPTPAAPPEPEAPRPAVPTEARPDRAFHADLTTLRVRPAREATAAARRLARRHADATPADLAAVRPLTGRLLEILRELPDESADILRLIVTACPAPWSPTELAGFADATDILLAHLADVDGIAPLLTATASGLPTVTALELADRIRELPPHPRIGPILAPLLRACGAVRTRADLDRALSGARLGANPWEAELAILGREFIPNPTVEPTTPEPPAWRARLDEAARVPGRIAALPPTPDDPDSRTHIVALVAVYPHAHPDNRAALLDRLTELQPIDAPAWTRTEAAGTTPAPSAPEDHPRSAARLARLTGHLTAPEPARRLDAARELLTWPEPAPRRAVLDAHLRGDLASRPDGDTALVLAGVPESDLRALAEPARARAARLCAWWSQADLIAHTPVLLAWWEHGAPDTRTAAASALDRVPAAVLAEAVRERLDAGAWTFLDLLTGRPTPRTPELTETVSRLRAEGRDDLADRLRPTDGPLRDPGAAHTDHATLAALRTRPEPVGAPTRADLIHTARTGEPEQIRRALSRLADEHGDHEDVRDLVVELLDHRAPRVRSHAHRVSRRVLDRPEHLAHTLSLLDDPRQTVVRSAIRTLTHAAWAPAAPAMIALLTHPDRTIRTGARDCLRAIGPQAVPALRRAAAHARPDRRAHYTSVLADVADRPQSAPRPHEGPTPRTARDATA